MRGVGRDAHTTAGGTPALQVVKERWRSSSPAIFRITTLMDLTPQFSEIYIVRVLMKLATNCDFGELDSEIG
jgi:hypothetical protein